MGNRKSLTEKIIRIGFVEDEAERIKEINELLSDVISDVQKFLNPISDLEEPLLAATLRFVSETMMKGADEESIKITDSYYGLLKEIFQCERKDIAAINVETIGKRGIYGI